MLNSKLDNKKICVQSGRVECKAAEWSAKRPSGVQSGRAALLISLVAMLFLAASVASASPAAIDSLTAAYDRNGRLATANELLRVLYADEGIIDEPLKLASGTPRDSVTQQVNYWAAEYYYATQHYDKAVARAEAALPLMHGAARGDCLNLLAVVNIRLARWGDAARYAKECNALDRAGGDPDMISSSLNTLAAIYMGARQPQLAEKYVLEGIEQARLAGNPSRMAVLQGMASEVYHTLGSEEKSLAHATAAWQLEDSLGRPERAAMRLSQMAAALLWLKRTDEAYDALQRAIPVLREAGNVQSLAISLNQMGGVMLARGDKAKAAECYTEAADTFVKLHDYYNESHSRLGLYNALKDSDPKAALVEMERYKSLKDSIYDAEAASELARYSAQLENEALAEENLLQRDTTRRVVLIGGVIAAALVLAALAGWWLMRRRQRRQSLINETLEADIDELRRQYSELQQHYDNAIAPTPTDDLTDADREFIEQLVVVINEQIAGGQPDAKSIASRLGMTPYLLRQRLASVTDEPLATFVQRLRMRRARYFLDKHHELNVNDVAALCGYSDTPNFTRAFKKAFGITPSDYSRR